MKLLVIPTTDWVGHPVPNRLNFIFDRLADRHEIDVCHFRIFPEKLMDTDCNLIAMDTSSMDSVKRYYIRGMHSHLKKIRAITPNYDAVIASNILPTFGASLQSTPLIIDYLDLFPQSAAAYFFPPFDTIVRNITSFIDSSNLHRCNGIITTSNRFRTHLSKKYDKPIHVVPNGVDTTLLKPTNAGDIKKNLGSPVIGYVGSLENWIDLEWVIRNFSHITEQYPNASLLIVGPGLHTTYGDKIKKMAKGINVRFTGRVPYEQLSHYISAMDVGLNPRKPLMMNTLTMGSKVLNYLACGVPVLSTNMPEVETLFGPNEGVFGYQNIDEFVIGLSQALNRSVDPDVVKDYDWDKIADKYEDAIIEIIGK